VANQRLPANINFVTFTLLGEFIEQVSDDCTGANVYVRIDSVLTFTSFTAVKAR